MIIELLNTFIDTPPDIEDVDVDIISKRLAEIAGEGFKSSSYGYRDPNTKIIKQKYQAIADKSLKIGTYEVFDIQNHRFNKEAVSRNNVSMIWLEDSWLAVFGKTGVYYCRSTEYSSALFGCLVKALDAGEELANLAPITSDPANTKQKEDPLPDMGNGEDRVITHRKAIEPEGSIVIK